VNLHGNIDEVVILRTRWKTVVHVVISTNAAGCFSAVLEKFWKHHGGFEDFG
jgi:ABC-type uncharacterized transport system permease subunit